MFRRRDRAAADPAPVMTMPRPPWLDDPTDSPDTPPDPNSQADQLDRPLPAGPTGVGAAGIAEHDRDSAAGAGETVGAGPIDIGEAAQVAVCWAVDHLSGDPDVPARRAEFAVPGQIWTDPSDPAVTWVDLRVLVAITPADPADRVDSGTPPDTASDTATGTATGAPGVGGGAGAFGGLAGRGLGWEQHPASRPDRQWWHGPVALRRHGSGEITVDRALTSSYLTPEVAADDDGPSEAGSASAAAEGGVCDVD